MVRALGVLNLKCSLKSAIKSLHTTSTTDKRCHTATIFASEVLSIYNLVKRAQDNIEEKVSAGILEEMPLVPYLEWVRLQFSPNNETVKKAIKFTTNIGI